MTTKNSQNSQNNFNCEHCDYFCSKKSDYEKHLLTKKHINTTTHNEKNPKSYPCECGKIYNYRASLFNHKKRCIISSTINENIVHDASANEIKVLTSLVIEVMKTNTELQKQNQEFQKQMIDVCKNIQPSSITNTNSNNTTNNNNKTFNLNFFLNEQCKDAMNIKDFVQSIQIEMSDLERIGKEGYVEGISKLILEKLRETDIYKRPLHCSDAKRETMYIKEDDVWNKDESLTNEKLVRFIKDVDNKNYDFLMAYAHEYPEVYDQNSILHTPYLHMVIQSTRDNECLKKVIKKIVKEVLINKDNYLVL
jgi:hypothetical protein